MDFMTRHNIKIAAIQETKLDPKSKLPPFWNYAVVRKDRNRHGGGLALLIHHSIPYSLVPLPRATSPSLEQQAVKIKLADTDLLVINIYIPPVNSCPERSNTSISHLLGKSDRIILGDFNAHDQSWFSSIQDQRGTLIAAEVEDADFGICNTKSPTRLPIQGQPTSPDVSLASPSLLTAIEWTPLTALSSDHLPILLSITTTLCSDHSMPNRTFTNFARADWDRYLEETEHLFSEIDLSSYDDPHVGEKVFLDVVHAASRHTIPAGRVKGYVPGLSKEVSAVIKNRDRIRSNDPTDPRVSELNSQISSMICVARREKWEAFLSTTSIYTKPSLFWKTLKSLNGHERAPPNAAIEFQGKQITNSLTMANRFNRQFSSVRTHQSDNSARRTNRSIRKKAHHLSSPIEFDRSQVAAAIKASKPSKAFGADKITILHLKHLGLIGLSHLTKLINNSLRTFTIPRSWKTPLIVPLLKPGKPSNISTSYRPVSLLSPIAKVIERLILPSITEALPPAEHQHGFRPNHSTVTALLHLSKSVASGFNKRRPPDRTVAVALDLSKAFDMVDINTLLQLLTNSPLHPGIVRWLASYLKGRQSRVLFRGKTSSIRIIRTGVPQGSVISPALFNIYLKDLPLPPDGISLVTYADDITLFKSGTNIQEICDDLNEYLEVLHNFLRERKLLVSAAKSTVTLFTSDNKQFHDHPPVLLDNNILPLEKNPKILGVKFDPSLSFNAHAQLVSGKMSQRQNIMRAVAGSTWGQQKETLLTTYKALSRSVCTYAAPVWAPGVSNSSLELLQRKQNAALRISTGCVLMSPIDHLHQECKVLPVKHHLNMLSTQFLAQCGSPSHPCHSLLQDPASPRRLKKTIFNTYTEQLDSATKLLPEELRTDPKKISQSLHSTYVQQSLQSLQPNTILQAFPPPISDEERGLPRKHRSLLAQLRSGHCSKLRNYQTRLNPDLDPTCQECHFTLEDVPHLFQCPAHQVSVQPIHLWTDPKRVVEEIKIFDPGGSGH